MTLLTDLGIPTTPLSTSWEALTTYTESIAEQYMSLLREAAPHDFSAYCEYMSPEEPPESKLHQYFCDTLSKVESREIERVAVSVPPGCAKDFDLEEWVPTPKGYVKNKDLKLGDEVFKPDGTPVKITHVSEVFYNNECYKAYTKERDVSVVVGKDHLWTVRLCRKSKKFNTFTTSELYERQGRMKWFRAPRLPNFEAVKYPKLAAPLPLHPYVLGLWLGDGHADGGTITACLEDQIDYVSRIASLGYTIQNRNPETQFGIADIRKHLVSLNVLNNKHIPECYLRASPQERRELLKGLMDSDGTAAKKRVSFTNTNKDIIDGFRELLFSLGIKNSYSTSIGKVYGDKKRRYWEVSFCDDDSFNLDRKLQIPNFNPAYGGRYILFEKTNTIPTRCITVDSEDGLFLVGKSHLVTHNSHYWSRMFPTWYLGRNPRHKYLSAAHSQTFAANELGKKCRALINQPEYSEVFPGIKLSKDSKAAESWGLSNGKGGYQTKGVGQAIAGHRAHIGGVDDPFGSRADAESAVVRESVFSWFMDDFMTRLLPNSPAMVVATRWHSDDLIGRIEEMNIAGKGIPYSIINLPALCEQHNLLGLPENESIWPEFYPKSFYLEKKSTLSVRGWNSLYMGVPVDISGGVMQQDWIFRYDKRPSYDQTEPVTVKKVVVSIDSANTAKERSDYTVLQVWMQGSDNRHYLVDNIKRRVEFEGLCKLLDEVSYYWKANVILVEDRGSGTQLIQVRGATSSTPSPIPLVPISTKNLSKEFRFDAVTPMFSSGLVLLPRKASWLKDYTTELLSFPSGKFKDSVDASSQYLEWARQTVKLGSKKLHTR